MKNILNAFRAFLTRLFCKHKDWYCDKQITVVECIKCGKRARIIEYIHLFDEKREGKRDDKGRIYCDEPALRIKGSMER